jgi:hypothetical protein
MRSQKLVKMVGAVSWCALGEVTHGQIDRAILHEDGELSIGLQTRGYKYAVNLKRQAGDRFDGTMSHKNSSVPWRVCATLYRSSDGELLFGEWSEGNKSYQWWAALHVVDRFPNEG